MGSGTWISMRLSADAVKRNLQAFGYEMPRAVGDRILMALVQARKQMMKPGQKPTYPINWDSQKQRRAYFATDGFGHGIPYKRTNEYVNGWVVQENPSNQRARYGYSLRNPVPHSKYVGGAADGTGQSWIHFDRWALLRDAVDKVLARIRADVREQILLVKRRRFGS